MANIAVGHHAVVRRLLESLGLKGRPVSRAVLVIDHDDALRLYVQEFVNQDAVSNLADELTALRSGDEVVQPDLVVERVNGVEVDQFGNVSVTR